MPSRRFILSLLGSLLFLLPFRKRPAMASIFFKPKKKVKPRTPSDLFTEGDTALVKPNCVSGEKNPVTTNPEVVRATVETLYEQGAKKVYVGDMSALATIS